MRPDGLAEGLPAARWAVERWAGFPVDRVPRPPVLIGGDVRVDGGFRSNTAKLALVMGRIEAAVAVPEPVLHSLRRESGPESLRITAATLGEHEFLTDRGRRRLPAWRLESPELTGAIWVLAPDAAALAWSPPGPAPPPPPGVRHDWITGSVCGDGRALRVSFTGGPENAVAYDRAEVVESDRAVAVVPVERLLVGPSTIITAVGVGRAVDVRLAQPLGARVLVGLDARPAEVMPG
jgi:hypothetical protein